MPYFLVEREFEQPVPAARFEKLDDSVRFCFDAWRVRHVRTYVSGDGHRVLCVFEAPDAEAIAAGSAAAAMPVTRVREVTLHHPPPELAASSPKT